MKNLKKSKKVLILVENLLYGGVTTHLLNLIKSKNSKNIKFIIVTNESNYALKNITKSFNKKNIETIYYKSLNNVILSNYFFKLIFHLIRPLLFLISIYQVASIIKKINFDAFIANCGGYGNFRTELAGIFAAKILGKKNLNLLIHHNYTKPQLWSFLLNAINFFVKKSINKLIFVSHATKKSILSNTNLFNFSKNKTFVIHNGILLNKVKAKKLHYFKTKKKYLKIGMLARIEDYKGQLDLIEAFSKLSKNVKSKYKVYLIGRGNKKDEEKLKNKISQYKLKNDIKHIRYIDHNNLIILKNFDLYISLTRDFEGFGYSIAEALYLGLPVISTKVGGVVEFLNKNNAELIQPQDIKNLKKLLENFPFNKSCWKKKANNGKKLIVKKFNSEEMSKKYYNVIFNK